MPIGPKRMPFMQHIDELRKRLMIIVAVLFPLMMGLYFVTDPIYNLLVHPVKGILPADPMALRIFDPMMLRFKISIWAAVVVASPVIIWQVMAFFLPALKPRERMLVIPTFIAMVVLFLGGVVFCYEIIVGPGFKWLIDQSGHIMKYTPQATDLVTSISWFLLGFGIAFQTPVVVFYLVYFGIVKYSVLRENWRVAWVAMFVIAAIATPDWSPVNMIALAVCMIILYEISLLLVRIMLARKIARQRDEEDAD